MPSRLLLPIVALLLPAAAGAQASAADSTIAAITLERAVAVAQGRGLDADAARQSLVAARQRDRAFDAQFLPRLTLTSTAADVSRSFRPITLPNGETGFVRENRTLNFVELGIAQPLPWTGGAVTLGSRLTRINQLREGSNVESWQTTPFILGIRQSLFRPRAIVWDRREQDLQATSAERQFLETREEIAQQTAVAYFDLYAAQVQVDNSATNAAVNDTLYTLNTGRYEVGKIGENDLLQSELALLRARASLDGARLDRDRAAAALRRLLRLAPEAPVAAAAPPAPPPVTVDTALAVEQALLNASALTQAELSVTQRRRGVAVARSEAGLRADVEASFGLDQQASAFGDAYASPLERQQFTLAVDMPLLQWGAGRASVAAARAEQARAESQAVARREQVAEEARFAARQLMQAQRLLAISAKADTVAAKRFEVAKNRYVIGRIGINDLYVAQNEKDQAVLSYVQALRGYWAAHYRLRRLTLYDFEAGAPIRGEP